jgi:hypothetical protein
LFACADNALQKYPHGKKQEEIKMKQSQIQQKKMHQLFISGGIRDSFTSVS